MPQRQQKSCQQYKKTKRQCSNGQHQSLLPQWIRIPSVALAAFLWRQELETLTHVCKTLYSQYNQIFTTREWWSQKEYQQMSLARQEMVRKLTSVEMVFKLPPCLTHLSLCYLSRTLFPSTLTWLSVSDCGPLAPGDLPSHLKTLILDNYEYPLDQGSLPSSLTDLQLLGHFNQPWEHFILPDTLTSLKLGWKFNSTNLPDHLPPNLTCLTSIGWNHPLLSTVLPSCLQTLRLFHFNQPLTHLPPSLRSLELENYNHPLLQLPPLTELWLPDFFNNVVEFPTTLESLRLGSDYRLPVDGQRLVLLRDFRGSCHIWKTFPPKLETINGCHVDDWLRNYYMSREVKS